MSRTSECIDPRLIQDDLALMQCYPTDRIAALPLERSHAMRRRRSAVLLLALLGSVPCAVQAQEPAPGARVRIAAPALDYGAGLLLATTRDSLLIGFSQLAQSPVALARDAITSFEVSLGGDAARGAAIGAQIGFASGAVASSILHLVSRRPPPRFGYDHGDLAAAAMTGAAVGIVTGALLGAMTGQERWDSTALPRASAAALPPTGERATLQTRTRLDLFAPDDAIRVRTHDGLLYAGRYDGLDNGFMRIVTDSAIRVPIARIAAIDEQRAMTVPWLRRGGLIGAALGLAVVGVAALMDDGCSASDFCASPWGSTAAMFGIGGAFTGASVGAIAGSYVHGWRPQKW